MSYGGVIAGLSGPILAAVVVGCVLLRRALMRPKIAVEEIALAVSWAFLVGALFWLGIFLTGSSLLGFAAPWSWLAAAHFAFAGSGALAVTALCCRAVSNPRALAVLRCLVVLHPVAYLLTAAGIYGVRYGDEIGSSLYVILFYIQMGAVLIGRPDRIREAFRCPLFVALGVPLITSIPAITWAWGSPLLDLPGMVRYHGIVNAAGHVVLGLFALFGGRASAHSPRPFEGDNRSA